MKKIIGFILVLIISIATIRPLLGNGYFPMHDDTQVGRVVVMGKALREGQFPVRWVSDLGYGYGYPIFNFYAPLPYYFGGALYALGMSGLDATKAMMITGMAAAGFTMYFVIADLLGVSAAVVASVLYELAPYHAVQLYVRGAVGEFWTLIFFPLIIWGLVSSTRRHQYFASVVVSGLGIAGVILSHTILGYATILVFTFLVIVWQVLYRIFAKKLVIPRLWIIPVMTLGLGISAFFWLPAIAEMHYTNVAAQISQTADYRDHFVCLSQLWSSPWGFGGTAKGCVDGLSFMLGKIHIVLALAAVVWWILFRSADNESNMVFGIGLVVSLIGGYLVLAISKPVWEAIPLFSFVQYPWRFLAYMIFGLSVLGGVIIALFKNHYIRITLAVLCSIIAVVFYLKLFQPQYLYSRPASAFESEDELKYRVSKISDEYLPPAIIKPQNAKEVVHATIASSDNLAVAPVVDTDMYARFQITSTVAQVVEVKKAYFPGWQYLVNGIHVSPDLQNGLPYLQIPAGYSVVELTFTNTPIRLLANSISLIVLGTLVYFIAEYDKKTNA